MHEQTVHGLERHLREVLVGAVDRVARLEPDDPLPAALGDDPPRLGRILRKLREGRDGPLEHGDLAGEVEGLLRVQTGDTGVGLVGRAEAELGLTRLVVLESLLHVEHRDGLARLVAECDPVAGRRRVDGEAHGKSPWQPAREMHVRDDALVVGLAHEPLERRERARGDHVEVGELAGSERDDLERVEIGGRGSRPVDERAAVRRDDPIRRRRGHAATSAVIRPSSSRRATTCAAASSSLVDSVSTTISAASGASYGSSTPVKPLISPANALA